MSVASRAQLIQPEGRITIEKLMPGAAVIHAAGEQILCGFPEEVAKACIASDRRITAWLLPDVRSRGGIVQWALEFPLYLALFAQGLFAQKKKLVVFATESDWKDAVESLRLTLLGLTREEMVAQGVEPETAAFLDREARSLALKREDGALAAIEDFLQPVLFDASGAARHGGLTVTRHGGNTWSFATEVDRVDSFALDFAGEPLPPYTRPLNLGVTPVLPQQLEVITLGASNGFDAAGPCSNLLVQSSGHFLMIDAGPYVREVVEAAGISLQQIEGLVITHAHEDHAAGISALSRLGRRIRLFTARETAAILRRKLAILNPEAERPDRLLDEAFEVVYVAPGEPQAFFGLALEFHYTLHAIPCLGVELSCDDGGVRRRVLVTGDNASRASIEEAYARGTLSPARYQALCALFERDCDLVIADGGGGLIHGVAADFEKNPSTNVVYLHTGKLPGADAHRFTLATPGCRYTIAPENSRPSPLEREAALSALQKSFRCEDPEALSALLDGATPLSMNRGQIAVRQNDRTRDFFAVLSGKLAVLADGRPVAEIHPGEVFGEMAVLLDGPRTATVKALTPVRLLRIGGEALRRFAQKENLGGQLRELWARRSEIQSVDVLAPLPLSAIHALARSSERRAVAAGAELIREGARSTSVYALLEGRLQVFRGGAPLEVNGAPVILHPGQLVGEAAALRELPRNASVVALDECQVLEIRGEAYRRALREVPELRLRISMMVRARKEG